MKPREPAINELAGKLVSLHGVDTVSISVVEIDQSTESVKVSVEGTEIGIDGIRKSLEDSGAVIHSIDEVTVAKKTK